MHIITMKEAVAYLQQQKTFRASNLQGIRLTYKGEVKSYVVFSYATAIYAVRADGSEFINRLDEKFSPTTSRHQNIIRRAFNIK